MKFFKFIICAVLVNYPLSVLALSYTVDISSTSATDGSSNNIDTLANTPADGIVLGQAFDPDLGRWMSSCLKSQQGELAGGTGGQLTVFGDYTQYDLERDMSQSGSSSIVADKFSSTSSNAHAQNSKSRALSFVFRMKQEFYDRSTVYRTTSLNDFEEFYRGLIDSGDLEQFRRSCGDRFVKQIKRGGAIYATVRLDFSSQEDYNIATNNGSTSITAGSITGSSGSSFIESLKTKGVHGTLVVFAVQRGGEPTELAKIFGGTGVDGKSNSVTCTIQGGVDACINMISDVIAYGKIFSQQFTDMATYPNTKYDVLQYVKQSFFEAYAIPQIPKHPDVLPDIRDKRSKLLTKLESMEAALLDARNVLAIYETKHNKTYAINQSNYISTVILNNITNLNVAGRECWYFPTSCFIEYIKVFPAEGSRNPDGTFNPAPTLDPNGSGEIAPSTVQDINADKLKTPAYIASKIFITGGSQVFFTQGNGDYCPAYDERVYCTRSGWAKLACRSPDLTPNYYSTESIFPAPSKFDELSTSDLDKFKANMELAPNCKLNTDDIYSSSNGHPYTCHVERDCSGWACLVSPNPPMKLVCPDIAYSKPCDGSQDIYNDFTDALRCL